MSDGNKRYLGDTFINEENYKRQKEFFRDIIESYQWKYGGNFDASTLQEKTPDDFATRDQGIKADHAILEPLSFGKTEIINQTEPHFIYTDAILLDRDGDLDTIDWYKNLENDSVTDALVDVYNQVMEIENSLNETKLDKTVYNTFLTDEYEPFRHSFDNVLETFTDIDQNGDEVEVTKINSDLVNGLRFILTTQERYDNFSEAYKKYWRNVFIIKEAEDIPPDYVDPMTWQLSDGYEFAIIDGKLQFTNGLSNRWKPICTLEELLSGADFDSIIKRYVERDNDYVLEEHSLTNSIKGISSETLNSSNWNTYPFLFSSLHDDFVESVTINGSSSNVTTSVNSNTNFKKVDLNINGMINSSLSSSLSPIQETITGMQNTINEEKRKLSGAQSNINSILTGLNVVRTQNSNQDTRLSEIDNTLQSINDNLRNLSNSIGDWKTENISGLKYTSDGRTYQSLCMYNEALKIAYVYIHFGMYITSNELKKEVEIRTSKNSGYKKFYAKAKPMSTSSYSISAISPLDFVKMDPDGRILFYTTRATAPNAITNVLASWTYRYSSLRG